MTKTPSVQSAAHSSEPRYPIHSTVLCRCPRCGVPWLVAENEARTGVSWPNFEPPAHLALASQDDASAFSHTDPPCSHCRQLGQSLLCYVTEYRNDLNIQGYHFTWAASKRANHPGYHSIALVSCEWEGWRPGTTLTTHSSHDHLSFRTMTLVLAWLAHISLPSLIMQYSDPNKEHPSIPPDTDNPLARTYMWSDQCPVLQEEEEVMLIMGQTTSRCQRIHSLKIQWQQLAQRLLSSPECRLILKESPS